jgi:transcriptional regulator with XRE-family HTH domain
MEFGEKIKTRRCELGLSQTELASVCGISLRSVQNYESGQRHPANISIVKKIAKALKVGHEYLLDDAAQYVIDAAARGGENAAHDVDRLLSDIQGLFAGGELTPQDKDKVMRAINEIYWESKETVK